MSDDRLFTRPFVICALASLTQGMSFNLFLHLPPFLSHLGASEVEIGLLNGLTGVSAVAVRKPIGRAMDVSGRRGVILLGGVLNTITCTLYLSVSDLGPWVYALRMVHGVAEAMLFTALFTYAADCVPASRRTQGLALFGVSGMLPMALSGVLGDWLRSQSGFDSVFATAGGFALVSLLLSFGLYDFARTSAGEEPARKMGMVLRQRNLVPLWWLGIAFATAMTASFTFVPLYVEKDDLGTVGEFFAAYAAIAILLRIFLGWLPDRIGPKRVLFPALLCMASGFVMLAVARDAADIWLAGALCGMGHGFTFPILFGMVVTRARDAERGSAMAIYTALFDAAVVIGGPGFGWIHYLGGYPALFASAAAIIVVGTIVFAWWDRER